MIKEKLRKAIEEIAIDNEEEVLFLDNPSFDKSIIGITNDFRLIYDFDKMVEELMEDDQIDYEDAIDFIDHNTLLAIPYFGEQSPIIKMSFVPYYDEEEEDDMNGNKAED